MPLLIELDEAYKQIRFNEEFWREADYYLKEYVGRPSLLTYAANLSKELRQKYISKEKISTTPEATR